MFPPPSSDPDTPVRLTNNDAALARLSAVQKGYLTDPFVSAFVPRAHLQPPRPPLINIGTYVRTVAIDELVAQWLALSRDAETQCQIVSMGAGSDSRFWRIAVCIPVNVYSLSYHKYRLANITVTSPSTLKSIFPR